MDDKDMQAIKEEMAQLATRLDSIDGCFQNFDTTLTNHMTDYKKTQEKLEVEQSKIRDAVGAMSLAVAKIQGSEGLAIMLIKWVIVPLIAILAGLIGMKLLLPGGVL